MPELSECLVSLVFLQPYRAFGDFDKDIQILNSVVEWNSAFKILCPDIFQVSEVFLHK